jgi:hypothetical protein
MILRQPANMFYRNDCLLSIPARTALLVALLTPVLSPCQALAGCNSPAFGPSAAFPVGTYPKALVVGDFNGDGKADLAVANQGDVFGCETNQNCNTISILLGNGNGTFLAAVNHFVGAYPAAIAAGDFNADNKLDLVVANSTDPGTVSVCLGIGNGTFQAAVGYGTGVTPGSVAVGDFNKDNRLDLAVANYVQSTSASLSVLLGKGDGTFHTRTNYGAGNYPESVAIGDFNEDTNPDLTVANNQGIAVLLGNGNGTFQARTNFPAGTMCESVTVGDFNQDNNADIAVVNDNQPGTITIRYGLGNGTFQALTNHATGTYPLSLESSDYNGDGKPDFAVVDDTGISVLLRTTNGTWQTTTGFTAGAFPYALATGDFNGDGSPDLATSSFATNGMVSRLLNACANPGNSIAGITRLPGGNIRFTVLGAVGETYRVLGNTNLSTTNWITLANLTNQSGTVQFTDSSATNFIRRFYRTISP